MHSSSDLQSPQHFPPATITLCWSPTWRESPAIWNSCLFVQILWLFLCSAIKDL
ncbi:hypothetical protein DPEC_G00019360 [Dallia pectoralis]|uniref:Uncharacterized protein n=1 Tax=Dallia pectoralis TaxID=75939 RepID=A0ACC2HFJ6_DALPE|nr:hypothetical protein DPEC_G00019360 [Dallia pectoralis]